MSREMVVQKEKNILSFGVVANADTSTSSVELMDDEGCDATGPIVVIQLVK
jgi:hypothetical protein